MHWWWISMGAVIVITGAIAPRLCRRHSRRVQVDRVRTALSTWLPALNQPNDTQVSGVVAPPTLDFAPSVPSVVRCRRTLMFGALYPNISVGPRRAT